MSSEIRVATTQHKYLQRVILKRIIQVRLFNVLCFCMHILGIFPPWVFCIVLFVCYPPTLPITISVSFKFLMVASNGFYLAITTIAHHAKWRFY